MNNYQNARLPASSAGRDRIGLHAEMRVHLGILRSRNSADTELIFVVRAGADFGGRPRRRGTPIEADGCRLWLAPAGFAADLAEFPGEIVQALHIYLPATLFASSYWREEDAARAIACLDYGSVFRDALLEEMARAILLELENATPDGPPLLEALGTCVAMRLIHSHTKSYASATCHTPAARRTPAAGHACERRLSKVVEYIDTHLDDNLRIQDLAGIACLSRFHFARAFKRSVGKSPHQYISTKRMHLALSLLTEDTLCLARVARACGFSTQSSFNKAFTRATGQCPGHYRRTRFEGSGAECGCRNKKAVTTAAMDNLFAAMDKPASAAAQYS